MRKTYSKSPRFKIVADENTDEAVVNKEPKENSSILQSNQVYFYDDVTRTSIFNLNRNLDVVSKSLQFVAINYNLPAVPAIDLYINSEGGEVFSAFSAVDRIKASKVPIHSYIEGIAASAATLLSVVAHKRYIRKNSFMLIHQLSSGFWGNFAEFKDEVQNLELMMNYIKKIYLAHTKFTKEELDNILNRDIYLDAEQALEKGLVDEII